MPDVHCNFDPCRRIIVTEEGPLKGAWWLCKITPMPSEYLIETISDVLYGDEIKVNRKTRLEHLDSCNRDHKINGRVKSIVKELDDQEFWIVIKEEPYVLNRVNQPRGQCIAFCVHPEISLFTYPEHLHLNPPIGITYPASICYSEQPSVDNKRIDQTIFEITIWLLNHMLFSVNLKKRNEVKWFGKQGDPLDDIYFYESLHPDGRCRCGSGKKLKDCHLKEILPSLIKKKPELFLLNTVSKRVKYIEERYKSVNDEFRDFFLKEFDKVDFSQ